MWAVGPMKDDRRACGVKAEGHGLEEGEKAKGMEEIQACGGEETGRVEEASHVNPEM